MGLVISVALLTALAAGVVFASNSWGSYHWARTANPLPLSLGDNVSSNWDGHLTVANDHWNASAVLNNSVDPGRTSPKRCNPDSGLVEICNSKYGFNGWVGIAGIWVYSDGHIAKGYVKVNDSYFNTRIWQRESWHLHGLHKQS